MKKRFLLVILMFLAAVVPVSAGNISVSLISDKFYLGQTVQAEVQMDDFSVTKISLLGSSGNRLGASFFSQPYGEKHFVYFIFPPSLAAGSYSLFVSDRIIEEGSLKFVNATAPFSVEKTDAAFAVSPAIVRLNAKTGSFKLELRHTYGKESVIDVSSSSASLKPVRQTISVAPGESKSLFVDYKNFEEDASIMLKAGNISYAIPVVAVKEAAPVNETAQNEIQQPGFENAIQVVGNVSSIIRKVKQNIVIAGPVSFKNTHPLPLHNLLFSASGVPGVEFNMANVPLIMSGETFTQQITINRQKDAIPGKYDGEITAESDEGAKVVISLSVEFEAVEAPAAPVEPKKKANITVSEAPASLNISFNYSEVEKKTDEERMKSLKIAVILIIAVVALAALLIFKIRPKVKYKKMQEYAKGAGK
ncbi:MAG: hypothetical protein KJ955_05965 [Nanoarchaeota archaeon]|nr:hypothetical protein [Nanoarchaeota archaeon]